MLHLRSIMILACRCWFILIIFATVSSSNILLFTYHPEKAWGQSSTQSYFNQRLGISIEYPSYFTEFGPGSNWVASFTSSTGRGTFFLNVETLPFYQDSLYSFVQSKIDVIPNEYSDVRCLPGVPCGEPQSDLFGIYSALSYQWSYTDTSGRPWVGFEVWTLNKINGGVYSLTFLSPLDYFDAYVTDINEIIASFRFVS